LIDEETPLPDAGLPQMSGVCRAWERAFADASSGVARTVLLRPSIAIGPDDPLSKRLILLARAGLGGPIGSGRQWVSWVALEDLINVIVRAIDDESMRGLYHVTSPNPITNGEMMATYRSVTRQAFSLRT